MAPILKKTEEELKKAGRKVEDVGKVAAHDTVVFGKKVGRKVEDVGKEVAHGTAGVAREVGHKTAAGAGRFAGKLDITCDKCGKLMSPGGTYKRTFKGKEHQFCSVLCADHYKPSN